jgi:hypothetical protein
VAFPFSPEEKRGDVRSKPGMVECAISKIAAADLQAVRVAADVQFSTPISVTGLLQSVTSIKGECKA